MLVLHHVYFIITSFIHQIDKTKSIIYVCVKCFYMNYNNECFFAKDWTTKNPTYMFTTFKKNPSTRFEKEHWYQHRQSKWNWETRNGYHYLKIPRKTIDANVCTRLETEVISLRKPFTILPRRIEIMNINHLIEKLYNWYVF